MSSSATADLVRPEKARRFDEGQHGRPVGGGHGTDHALSLRSMTFSIICLQKFLYSTPAAFERPDVTGVQADVGVGIDLQDERPAFFVHPKIHPGVIAAFAGSKRLDRGLLK